MIRRSITTCKPNRQTPKPPAAQVHLSRALAPNLRDLARGHLHEVTDVAIETHQQHQSFLQPSAPPSENQRHTIMRK